MRYQEFIVESVSDTKDIHMASQWLADRIIRHRIQPRKTFHVTDIFDMEGKDTLPIDYGNVSQLLLDDGLGFIIDEPRESKREGRITNGSFYPNSMLIYINSDLLKQGVASVASTIGHELRHALDFILSGGKPFRKKAGNTDQTHDQYLRNPLEINARFTQALWAMAFDTMEAKPKTAHDALAIIDDCLYRLHLDRALFPAGPTGDKRFNRLRSRAIQYWMQVARFLRSEEVEDMPKATLMDRIKSFISRFKLT